MKKIIPYGKGQGMACLMALMLCPFVGLWAQHHDWEDQHMLQQNREPARASFFAYGEETGARVLVYRFPNLFGKWCRPNYNSAVATFCYNTANDLPITVNDPSVELELLLIKK